MSRFVVKDFYFKKAKADNVLARSYYKLEEIDKKYSLIRANMHILDLGYSPGSWIQYTLKKITANGKVVGIDLKPKSSNFENQKNVDLKQLDFLHLSDLELDEMGNFDCVFSDMAPNTTGQRLVDQQASFNLVEGVCNKLQIFLRPNGNFVIKIFESKEAQDLIHKMKIHFDKTHIYRPKSTRKCSTEIYFVGLRFKL